MRFPVDPQEVAPTLDLCLRVGEILMSNGAGAADVTATMRSLAFHLGLRGAELDVTFTSLSMSWQDPTTDDPPVVMLRQVKQRDIDYEDLTRVDHLVRDVLADRTTLREARAEAARIASSGHQTGRAAITLAWGVMCGGVALMLGAAPLQVAVASVTAMLIDRVQLAMSRRRLPAFYQQVVGGSVATLTAIAAVSLGLAEGLSLMVTANIVMLLSGIGLMGALQDALSGFYVTSSARLLEAMLATAGIIGGVSGGLAIAEIAGMEVGRFVPGRTAALDTLTLMAVGAGIAAAAFAVASYAPWRVVPAIGLIAAAAALLAQAPLLAGFPRAWAVGIAALFIGLVSFGVSGRFRVPPLVVVVSAIVPLLPGLTIYRGLSLLTESSGDFRGVLALVVAASTALALAAGVILGEYLAQPLKREARRLESRLAGPRLVGPLRERTRGRRSGGSP